MFQFSSSSQDPLGMMTDSDLAIVPVTKNADNPGQGSKLRFTAVSSGMGLGSCDLGLGNLGALVPLPPPPVAPEKSSNSAHAETKSRGRSIKRDPTKTTKTMTRTSAPKGRSTKPDKVPKKHKKTKGDKHAKRDRKLVKKATKAVRKVNTKGNSRATSSKRATRSRPTGSMREPAEVGVGEVSFKTTPLESLFQWPKFMMEKVLSLNKHQRPVQAQVWTEFSGAGTAEIALDALAAAAPSKLQAKVISQADWDRSSQTALLGNHGQSVHLFGDIAGLCSEEMITEAELRVAVEVTWW